MVKTGPDLSYTAVEKWIDFMTDGEEVGWTNSCSGCPLAVCGQEQGFDYVFVSLSEVSWRQDAVWHTTPGTPFIASFIRIADGDGRRNKRVTAGQVRTILTELVPEFGPKEGAV